MVPRDGIEPPSVPCKGTALPLDERGVGRGIGTRTPTDGIKIRNATITSYLNCLVPLDRIELTTDAYKATVIPFN